MSLAAARRIAISDAKALAWLLFSPYGWIGRINFLRGTAATLVVNWVLLAVALRLVRGIASPEQFATAILGPCLLTLYPSLCVAGKRLHSLGLSAWVQAPVRLLMMTGLVLLALYQDGSHSELMNGATGAALCLGVLAEIAMFICLAAAPNRPGVGTPAAASQA